MMPRSTPANCLPGTRRRGGRFLLKSDPSCATSQQVDRFQTHQNIWGNIMAGISEIIIENLDELDYAIMSHFHKICTMGLEEMSSQTLILFCTYLKCYIPLNHSPTFPKTYFVNRGRKLIEVLCGICENCLSQSEPKNRFVFHHFYWILLLVWVRFSALHRSILHNRIYYNFNFGPLWSSHKIWDRDLAGQQWFNSHKYWEFLPKGHIPAKTHLLSIRSLKSSILKNSEGPGPRTSLIRTPMIWTIFCKIGQMEKFVTVKKWMMGFSKCIFGFNRYSTNSCAQVTVLSRYVESLLHSLGNYTRRAIFPKMCKINQSRVDFHCKPL